MNCIFKTVKFKFNTVNIYLKSDTMRMKRAVVSVNIYLFVFTTNMLAGSFPSTTVILLWAVLNCQNKNVTVKTIIMTVIIVTMIIVIIKKMCNTKSQQQPLQGALNSQVKTSQ